MITTGENHPIVYELRISAVELDVLLIKLQQGSVEKGIYGETQKELTDSFQKLQAIRSGEPRLVRYGTMDASRLNWQ